MLKKYFHTLRYLKPIQVYSRIKFRITSVKPDLRPCPGLRVHTAGWISPPKKMVNMMGPCKFKFLNVERELDFSLPWDHPSWGKLWTYHLHYFDDLNASNSEKRYDWHVSMLQHWLLMNPPGYGSGWEPYPISIRIVNWIKWVLSGNRLSAISFRLSAFSDQLPAVGCRLSEEFHKSLAIQTRFLNARLETHLLGNHLFANAKALVFSGLFFCGPEAQQWLDKGLRVLKKQIKEQILPDGGHFERSPMYHSIILEDILDLINIIQRYVGVGNEELTAFKEKCCRVVQQMRYWLKAMIHSDGQISLFNDAAFNIASLPKDIDDYARTLELGSINDPKPGMTHLKESGYIRIEQGPVVLIADVGEIGPDYIPGHAHADTLSFELSLYGDRVIVDSGTSCYERNEERLRQRSTAGHNTVQINGKDSSEVWSSFRVARRAKPLNLKIEDKMGVINLICAHDGYRRLPGHPLHVREWSLKENKLCIKDAIIGSFKNAQGRFHFHPAILMEITEASREGIITLNSGRKMKWKIQDGVGSIEHTTFHPGFGMAQKNACLKVNFTNDTSQISFTW